MVIVFGRPYFEMKSLHDIDWSITRFAMTSDSMIEITAERHGALETFSITTERAAEMGLINLSALNPILSKKLK